MSVQNLATAATQTSRVAGEITELLSLVGEGVKALDALLGDDKPQGVFPQEALETMACSQAISKVAGDTASRIEVIARDHYKRGGEFEGGKYKPHLNVTTRRSVKWKDEALRQAEARHNAEMERDNARDVVSRVVALLGETEFSDSADQREAKAIVSQGRDILEGKAGVSPFGSERYVDRLQEEVTPSTSEKFVPIVE